MAASGDPRAATIIGALQTGTLYVRADHALFIKGDDGKFGRRREPAQPAPDVMASGLKQVRVNNAVRSAIDAALGQLATVLARCGDTAAGRRGGVRIA